MQWGADAIMRTTSRNSSTLLPVLIAKIPPPQPDGDTTFLLAPHAASSHQSPSTTGKHSTTDYVWELQPPTLFTVLCATPHHIMKDFYFLHPKVNHSGNLNYIIQPAVILTSHLQSENIKKLGISIWDSLTARFKLMLMPPSLLTNVYLLKIMALVHE